MKKWSPSLEVDEWFYGLRSQWRRALRSAASAALATRRLVAAHHVTYREQPEYAIFYLMLAHYQCDDRCLQPGVRRRALAIIERGAAAVLWLDTSARTPRRRRADFDKLKREIFAQGPARSRSRSSSPRTPRGSRPRSLPRR
jgi:hypothetical protein